MKFKIAILSSLFYFQFNYVKAYFAFGPLQGLKTSDYGTSALSINGLNNNVNKFPIGPLSDNIGNRAINLNDIGFENRPKLSAPRNLLDLLNIIREKKRELKANDEDLQPYKIKKINDDVYLVDDTVSPIQYQNTFASKYNDPYIFRRNSFRPLVNQPDTQSGFKKTVLFRGRIPLKHLMYIKRISKPHPWMQNDDTTGPNVLLSKPKKDLITKLINTDQLNPNIWKRIQPDNVKIIDGIDQLKDLISQNNNRIINQPLINGPKYNDILIKPRISEPISIRQPNFIPIKSIRLVPINEVSNLHRQQNEVPLLGRLRTLLKIIPNQNRGLSSHRIPTSWHPIHPLSINSEVANAPVLERPFLQNKLHSDTPQIRKIIIIKQPYRPPMYPDYKKIVKFGPSIILNKLTQRKNLLSKSSEEKDNTGSEEKSVEEEHKTEDKTSSEEKGESEENSVEEKHEHEDKNSSEEKGLREHNKDIKRKAHSTEDSKDISEENFNMLTGQEPSIIKKMQRSMESSVSDESLNHAARSPNPGRKRVGNKGSKTSSEEDTHKKYLDSIEDSHVRINRATPKQRTLIRTKRIAQ